MKNLIKYLFLALIALFAFNNLKAEEVKFITGSYNDILKLAKSENKIIMADAYTDWCIWCKQLDLMVYTVPSISEYANRNQINWKFDAEKGEGIELAKKFNITGYPTLLFIDGDGNEVDRIYGYYPAKEFLEVMEGITSGTKTVKNLKQSLAKTPDDVNLNYELTKRYLNLGMNKEAEPLFKKIISLDPDSKYGYTDYAEFQLAIDAKDESKIQTLMSKYPSSKMLKDVKMYYLEKYMESPDEAKAQEIIQDLMKDYRTDEMAMYDVGTYYLVSGSKMLKDSASLTDGIRMEAMKNIDKCFDYYTGIFIAGPWKAKSEIYYQMKNKEKALECINKALAIWDKESYRKQKDKIEKL